MRTPVHPKHESAAAASRGAGAAARRGLALLAALALLGSVGCAGSVGSREAGASAAGTPGVSAAGLVEGVERGRFVAMVAVDRPKLERMLADSLRYCHSSGRCETKAEFLASLLSGQMKYRSIEAQQAGEPLSLRLSFTDVYELRGGIWQMVAWQSTRLP